MDCFALPVLGTETRVNAAEGANEFMIQYLEASPQVSSKAYNSLQLPRSGSTSPHLAERELTELTELRLCKPQVGRLENVVGWYHSHPGYGCWLSGIDVATQKTNQMFQDPFLAVVVSFALFAVAVHFLGARKQRTLLIHLLIYYTTTDRPQPHHLGRPCRDWRLPHLPRRELRRRLSTTLEFATNPSQQTELHSSQRVRLRVPVDPSQQDRGLWSPRQLLLPSRDLAL